MYQIAHPSMYSCRSNNKGRYRRESV